MLNMTAVKTIRMSPDKRNVKYIVGKAKGVFYFGVIWIRIRDPRSLRSLCIKLKELMNP